MPRLGVSLKEKDGTDKTVYPETRSKTAQAEVLREFEKSRRHRLEAENCSKQ